MTDGKDQAEIYNLIADLGFAGVLNMHIDRISTAMLMADGKSRFLGVKNGITGLKAFISPYLSEEDCENYKVVINEAREKKDGTSHAAILEFRYGKYLEALELLMKCLDNMGVLFEWRKKHRPYKQGEAVSDEDEGESVVDD